MPNVVYTCASLNISRYKCRIMLTNVFNFQMRANKKSKTIVEQIKRFLFVRVNMDCPKCIDTTIFETVGKMLKPKKFKKERHFLPSPLKHCFYVRSGRCGTVNRK